MATATIHTGATVTLNGRDYGTSAASVTLAGVTKVVDSGAVTCLDGPAGTLLLISATAGGNTLATIKYLEITNNETTGNPAIIGIINGSEAIYLEIPAGQTLRLWSDQIEANATGGAFSSLAAATSITGQGRSATASLSLLAFGT